ncbi:MAG: hypothetical protein K0U45_05570 [Alphaproteobacteria bacterium]|nr:hypothetical protein [Alphaproteobacteria bacterium]
MKYIDVLEKELKRQNRSAASVSKSAVGNYDLIRNWQRGSIPNLEKFDAVLKELNCRIEIITPADMRLPDEAYAEIPLLGVAEAGTINGFDAYAFDNETMSVPRPFEGHAAIKVTGDSMSPTYEDGDAVLIIPKEFTNPEEVVGRDAICEIEDGNALLKRVTEGKDGTFNLHSIHPSYAPILNARVRRFHRVIACLKQPGF